MARRNTQYEEDGIRLLPTPTRAASLLHHDVSLVNVESDSIPWRSLLPILFLRLADGMVYGVVFPFITAYLISLDAPSDKLGLYAGLAEGSLMAVEALLATTWASLADKYGRRPCMLWGLVSNLIACGALGFSTSVWQIILWRAACRFQRVSLETHPDVEAGCTRVGFCKRSWPEKFPIPATVIECSRYTRPPGLEGSCSAPS